MVVAGSRDNRVESSEWSHLQWYVVVMASRFAVGDAVQTHFGKGVVREIRNGNRLMVTVRGSALVFTDSEVSILDPPRKRSRAFLASEGGSERIRPNRESRTTPAEIDLHGLTVDDALDRVQQALSEALLADLSELRLIHGRSGGRILVALQRRLRETPSVRGFRLDPRNEGVTIVSL
jgi:DNA mismatch repair protein MutS2